MVAEHYNNLKRNIISVFLVICLIVSPLYTDKATLVLAKSNPIRVYLKIGNQTVSGKTISVQKGKKKNIKVTVPKKEKNKITFRSNRPNVVSVNKSGKFTAKKTGTAKVTVTVKKKYKSWVKIRVVSGAEKKNDSLPTESPTPSPMITSTTKPSEVSTAQPSGTPSIEAFDTPTAQPSDIPTAEPSDTPDISPTPSMGGEGESDEEDVLDMYNIEIRVNGKAFSAKLYRTKTTEIFMQKLPLSISMNELNGNEKYYYFSESFPTDSKKVSQIHAGDLKLYGSSCLVLFYESFSTSYSYTDLGYVENPEGLTEAVGSGNISVEFTGPA